MSTGRRKVFLSYRRSDTQHAAGRAADKLADRFELFMDVDTIPPGVDYTDYLKRAVGGCDVLLAFIGEKWAELSDETGRRRLEDPDDWVLAEIVTALTRAVPVIPVLVDGATLPAPERLPEQLRPLLKRQATPLRFDSFSADLAHLVAAIEHVGQPSDEGTAGTAPSDPDGPFADRWSRVPAPLQRTPLALTVAPRRRRMLPVLAAVVLAVAIGAGAWALSGRNTPSAEPSAQASTTAPTPADATPPATVPPATTVAQLKLRLPAELRPTCRKLATSDQILARDLVVALQCSPTRSGPGPRPRYAFYLQYADTAAARAAFRNYYAADPPGPGDCSAAPGEVLDDRENGSQSGVLRCYRDTDGYGVFAWIAPEQSIVASAADRDLDFAELLAWWGAAGPTIG